LSLTLLGAIVTLAATASMARPAGADPIEDKRAEAQAIQDQIDANRHQIGALAEQYNGAQFELDQAEAAIVASQGRLEAVHQDVVATQALVDERAASVYRTVLGGRSLDGFDVSDARRIVVRRKYGEAQGARDNRLLHQLAEEKDQLAQEKTVAEQARTTADEQRRTIAAVKTDLEAATADQQQLLGKVQGELATLVEEEQQRRAAAALAAAQARFAATSVGGEPEAFPDLPPPGPAAAAAIGFARTQIGKPYRYAAAGPDSYDCSGLVMAAYAAAGIRLYHYSGAQYAMLPHVALDSMLPGDLVFWGTGGSVHVAIYVGAGRILEAGGTDNNVHVGPIWGQPTGAARPAV
jgi:cell wall-associated NlpC family hydrolase